MSLPNLYNLAMRRAEISSIKCSNQNLINHELAIHQTSLKEYLPTTITTSTNSPCPLNLQNFLNQPYIDPQLRSRMIDSLITYHSKLRLSTPTLFQSISIMDRISCNYIIKDYNYKLVAIVSLWISSKFHDLKRRVPKLSQLIQLTQYRYDPREICSMELVILNNLGWQIESSSTFDAFIDSLLFPYLQDLGNDINRIKIWMLIICELCLFDVRLSMQYDIQVMTRCAFEIALSINQFSCKSGRICSFDVSNSEYDFTNVLNRIKRYLFSKSFAFPISVCLKYGHNILFDILKEYFIDQSSNNKIHTSERGQEEEDTSTSSTVVTTSSQIVTVDQLPNKMNYRLPMTPTTPDHPAPQRQIKKKLFCDIEERADSDSGTVSAKRVRIYK